jgi:nucleoside-diphosphate-sugar epimerase
MPAKAEGNFLGKHLVVFGCGYIGTAVATQAIARGLQVTALTRNTTTATLLREQGIATVVADLAGRDWHERVPAAPDYALDSVSSGGAGLDGYRRSYVDGMASIVEWAERCGRVGTLVYTSSTSVYPQDGGVVVDENAPTSDAAERGTILLEAEQRLREAHAACDRWFILRLAGIYGPGRHHLLEQVRAGAVAGIGRHRLNLAHRHDIAAAILACFGAGEEVRSHIFNVVDDEPTPKADVVAWLATRLGLPPPTFTGESAGNRRAVTPDRVIANGKLKAALGWKPDYPSFREGYESLLSR